MKKILLFALVIAVTTVFAFAAMQTPTAGSTTAAGYACPNLGWNKIACTSSLSDAPMQSVAFLVGPPLPMPNVGWNT
jgi:hypothetical protein